MSYLHINNLYKDQTILMFRECYALEKIHGTSAHISWNEGEIRYFAGGEKHETFKGLFSEGLLHERFIQLGHPKVVVYGEAYGGSCQGMNQTYGPKLQFVAFEVKIGESWLSVPQAEEIAAMLGLDFVPYVKCSTDLAVLDAERDKPSAQAVKCGIEEPRKREGVVLRPLIETTKNNGQRIIAKHKGADFQETKTPRPIDLEKLAVLKDAEAIAEEWVTPMRLTHVLQRFTNAGIEQTREVIFAMIEDVEREGAGEIITSPGARRAIGKRAAMLFKDRLQDALYVARG